MKHSAVTDVTALERQLARLADRQEITELVYRLGVALDDGRFDDLRSILTEDATASTPGGSVEGIEAVIAQAGRNHSLPDQRIQHVITNVLVDLALDRADVRANLVVTFASRASMSPLRTVAEVYRFAARRTPDGWRLSRVESTPVWTTGSRSAVAPQPRLTG